ncbi:MAG: NIPSNAP family protein [Gemmataceae bacterium]
MSIKRSIAVAALLSVAGYFGVAAPLAGQEGKKVDTHVYELRTYHTVPGRLPALHKRFRDHTCKLLEKHGMKLIGFWVPEGKAGENTLIYIVEHASRDAADKSWKAFGQDPDWQKAKADSEKDGKIVEKVDRVFMSPTDYSKLK